MRKILQNSVFLEAQISAFLEHGTVDEVLHNPNFVRWFGDSKVVDSEGKPLVCYHGTNRSFDEFDSLLSSRTNHLTAYVGYWFTPDVSIANYFSGRGFHDDIGANVLPVYLSIKKPYTFPYDESLVAPLKKVQESLVNIQDALIEFLASPNKEESYKDIMVAIDKYATYLGRNQKDKITDLADIDINEMNDNRKWVFRQIDDKIDIINDEIKKVVRKDPWERLSDSLRNALRNCKGSYADAAKEFLAPLLAQGYDGIILRNTKQDAQDSPYSDQYIVFSTSQIKSIYNNGSFSTSTSKISEEIYR